MADQEDPVPKTKILITLSYGRVTNVDVVAPSTIIHDVLTRAVQMAKTLNENPLDNMTDEQVRRVHKKIFGPRPKAKKPAAAGEVLP
jgi:hypothetical protein